MTVAGLQSRFHAVDSSVVLCLPGSEADARNFDTVSQCVDFFYPYLYTSKI